VRHQVCEAGSRDEPHCVTRVVTRDRLLLEHIGAQTDDSWGLVV